MEEFPPRMIVCVGSVVCRGNTILFIRQTYGENLKGKWSIPWGFTQGETPETYTDPTHIAAIREVHEEAGITAEIIGLLGIQHGSLSKEGYPRLYVLYLCRHVSGAPLPDLLETDMAAYFSLDELESIEAAVDPFCYWLAVRVFEGKYTVIYPELNSPYTPNLAFL